MNYFNIFKLKMRLEIEICLIIMERMMFIISKHLQQMALNPKSNLERGKGIIQAIKKRLASLKEMRPMRKRKAHVMCVAN